MSDRDETIRVEPEERIDRLPGVMARTGLSRAALYRGIQSGKFPKPVHLGKQARGWLRSEVSAWIRERRRERDK